jgi:hypothetical protein
MKTKQPPTPYTCPKCGLVPDPAELRKALNRELASRPKPGYKGKPSHNPAGRPKKVKP